MGETVSILVIDHDPATRAALGCLVNRMGYQACAAESGEEAFELLDEDYPNLAIVEVELPGMNGLVVLHELHTRFGDDLPVILMSAERDTQLDRTAGLLLGADAYLVKPIDTAELTARIRRLLRDTRPRARNGTGSRSASGDVNLSPREREILGMLAEGQSQKTIASALVISEKTVATHIQRLLGKLGVHSRAEAVATAYRCGLVSNDFQAHGLVVEPDALSNESVPISQEGQTSESDPLESGRF